MSKIKTALGDLASSPDAFNKLSGVKPSLRKTSAPINRMAELAKLESESALLRSRLDFVHVNLPMLKLEVAHVAGQSDEMRKHGRAPPTLREALAKVGSRLEAMVDAARPISH